VVRTRVGNRVLVPNSEVGASRVTILGSGQRAVAVPVRLGVAYGVPPDAAKAVLEGVAADIPGVLSDPPPKILTSEFADSAVVYECRLWTHTPWCRDDLTDELLTRAHAALARAGMEIPFPQRTLHRAARQAPIDSRDRRLQALRACDLFCDIPEEALGVLATSSRLRRFAPGEAAVRIGDRSTALLLVASGEAEVEQADRAVGRVKRGDFFGEAAFLTGSPRIATVRASKSSLEVVEIDEASLRTVLEQHSNLTDHLANKMAARRLEGESLRDESGALISPAGLAAQFRKHLLRIVGLSKTLFFLI
jgi:CRP-like cAMP-binding protein